MEIAPGLVRMATNGTLSPYGTTRIYAVDFYSSVSATNITLYNGSSNSADQILRIESGTQGTAHEEWSNGILFTTGVYYQTNTSATVVAAISYRKVFT